MKNQVCYVITDIHMGAQHDGLDEIIKIHKRKNKLFAKVVQGGGLVLFLNTAMTRAKLFREGGEVIGYLRTRDNRKLTEETLDLIPENFGGSLEYSNATKSALKKFFTVESAERASA